ncbi:MAG: hypothetical protein GY839_09625 [candidate division Zixibacteria bacterium]|nr:hypothetical protein [candidate division Zixibacteria bacterium]
MQKQIGFILIFLTALLASIFVFLVIPMYQPEIIKPEIKISDANIPDNNHQSEAYGGIGKFRFKIVGSAATFIIFWFSGLIIYRKTPSNNSVKHESRILKYNKLIYDLIEFWKTRKNERKINHKSETEDDPDNDPDNDPGGSSKPRNDENLKDVITIYKITNITINISKDKDAHSLRRFLAVPGFDYCRNLLEPRIQRIGTGNIVDMFAHKKRDYIQELLDEISRIEDSIINPINLTDVTTEKIKFNIIDGAVQLLSGIVSEQNKYIKYQERCKISSKMEDSITIDLGPSSVIGRRRYRKKSFGIRVGIVGCGLILPSSKVLEAYSNGKEDSLIAYHSLEEPLIKKESNIEERKLPKAHGFYGTYSALLSNNDKKDSSLDMDYNSSDYLRRFHRIIAFALQDQNEEKLKSHNKASKTGTVHIRKDISYRPALIVRWKLSLMHKKPTVGEKFILVNKAFQDAILLARKGHEAKVNLADNTEYNSGWSATEKALAILNSTLAQEFDSIYREILKSKAIKDRKYYSCFRSVDMFHVWYPGEVIHKKTELLKYKGKAKEGRELTLVDEWKTKSTNKKKVKEFFLLPALPPLKNSSLSGLSDRGQQGACNNKKEEVREKITGSVIRKRLRLRYMSYSSTKNKVGMIMTLIKLAEHEKDRGNKRLAKLHYGKAQKLTHERRMPVLKARVEKKLSALNRESDGLREILDESQFLLK